VKFDDDDDDEDDKRSKFKFQIKLAPAPPTTEEKKSSAESLHAGDTNIGGDGSNTVTSSSEASALSNEANEQQATKLVPLLALPKQQSSSMRGRRWGQKDYESSNDEFEQIIKRSTLTDSNKYTLITPDDLEDNSSCVGIPAIVVHPFVPDPDSPTELQLHLGEAVLILSNSEQIENNDNGNNVEDPIWYYGRLLREQQRVPVPKGSSGKPISRLKAGFFPSHYVFKLCELSLSFETAKYYSSNMLSFNQQS